MMSKRHLVPSLSLIALVAMLVIAGLSLIDCQTRAREDRLYQVHQELLDVKKSLVQIEYELIMARLGERRLTLQHGANHVRSFEEHTSTARRSVELLFTEIEDTEFAKPMLLALHDLDRYRDAVKTVADVHRKMGLGSETGYLRDLSTIEERLVERIHPLASAPLTHGLGQVQLAAQMLRSSLSAGTINSLLGQVNVLNALIKEHGPPDESAFLLAELDRYREVASKVLAGVSELEPALAESALQFERILPYLAIGHSRMDERLAHTSAELRSHQKTETLMVIALFTGALAMVLLFLMWQVRGQMRLATRLGELTTVMREVAEGNVSHAALTRLPERSDDLGHLAEGLATVAAQLQSQRDIIEGERERAFASENAARVKSQQLATTTHEMKTSLSGMLGLIELLEQTGLSAEQVSYSDIIRINGESLLTVVSDMHEEAKLEGGIVELERREFSLTDCIESALFLFTPRAQEKGLMIERRIATQVPDKLFGDDARLRQVLNHLLGSAIKFSEHGRVIVEVSVASRVESSVELLFVVRDTAMSVPFDTLKELFLPLLKKPEPAAPRRLESGGIGISISAELVEMMGGKIWVESKGEREAQFCFTVRIEAVKVLEEEGRASGQGHDAPHKLATDLAERLPLRILLAEDTEVNQMLMTRLFAKMGYSLDVARNGREAVELSRRAAYDLILMDIQMPEMDGWEASSIILQEADKDHRPRIVAVTANASEENRQRCMTVGMDDFVSKPFTLKRMQAVVERWGPS